MITDGNQSTAQPYTRLSVASQGIKNKGVTVYAIGVGSRADRAELEEIASGSENVLTSSSFSDLQDIAPMITKRLCAGESADRARLLGIQLLLVFDTRELRSFQLHVLFLFKQYQLKRQQQPRHLRPQVIYPRLL